MRTNKIAIIVLTPITIVSFLLAIIYRNRYSFTSNILLGIFGSSLLTLIMSVINYFNERRKTCERFYQYAKKAICNYSKYHFEYDFDKKINTILLINEFDYSELDDAYGDFAFLFNNKKLHKRIGTEIYKLILDAREIIAVKSFHFNEYKLAKNGNKQVINIFINELDEFFIKKEISTCEDSSTIITSYSNRIVEEIDTNLTGWYYELMYPKYKLKKLVDKFKCIKSNNT